MVRRQCETHACGQQEFVHTVSGTRIDAGSATRIDAGSGSPGSWFAAVPVPAGRYLRSASGSRERGCEAGNGHGQHATAYEAREAAAAALGLSSSARRHWPYLRGLSVETPSLQQQFVLLLLPNSIAVFRALGLYEIVPEF